MTQQTYWEKFNFIELKELASDDDVEINNKSELLDYLENRKDNYVEYLGDDVYNVLFA
jgi:hypothetical protein|tara:strand:+ start:95 stop:268 length:174 start_codon:yes stop_codon:yes gene_type:complete